MKTLWDYFLHSMHIHAEFAIVVLMAVAAAVLIKWIGKFLPPWEKKLVELAAKVLLSVELVSLAFIVILGPDLFQQWVHALSPMTA